MKTQTLESLWVQTQIYPEPKQKRKLSRLKPLINYFILDTAFTVAGVLVYLIFIK